MTLAYGVESSARQPRMPRVWHLGPLFIVRDSQGLTLNLGRLSILLYWEQPIH